MLKFKQFINEILNPEQEADVATWTKRTIKATKATDPYFGKGNEDKIESIASGVAGKSETHQAIEKHLNKSIEPEEYKEGKMKDAFGRKVRIGAVLGKTKAPTELARGFENDPTRQSKAATGLTVRTTRSASGVAGQTSGGQSWEGQSCKNFERGCNRKYLPAEVRHGVVASYLHDKDGKEIARATFAPYHNDAGGTMYKQTAYYGTQHAGFMEHNKQTEEALSGEHKGGSLIYKIHPKVYDNQNPLTAMHPNVSEQELTKTLATGNQDSQIMAAGHPKANAGQISAALESNYGQVALAAMRNPNANAQHITRGLNDDYLYIRDAAVSHPNVTSEHITKALDDPEAIVRESAMMQKAVTPEHINKALDDVDSNITTKAAKHPNATAENLTKAMDNKSKYTRRYAVEHPNATNEHITKGLADIDNGVRDAAIKHPSASAEQLTNALATGTDIHREGAIQNPSANIEHIKQALNDKDYFIREDAIRHPNATAEVIRYAAKNDTHLYVRMHAASYLKNRFNEDV